MSGSVDLPQEVLDLIIEKLAESSSLKISLGLRAVSSESNFLKPLRPL